MIESFIYSSYLKDLTICDKLIEFHKKSKNKTPGLIDRGIIDKSKKDSIDVYINGYDPIAHEYGDCLREVTEEYIKKFKWCNEYFPWAIIEDTNIQHYTPGSGYPAWHCERTGINLPNLITRHLVFMTYLNDVTDAGETEWIHQELKIQPRKGLTVIWPADWTHTHRGIISPSQDKYIITGWYNYVERK